MFFGNSHGLERVIRDLDVENSFLVVGSLVYFVFLNNRRLGRSFLACRFGGLFLFEDLPDLVSDDVTFQHVFTKDEYIPCMTRVTEVLSNIQ